jgi:methyl-accepting chemotaxis protein
MEDRNRRRRFPIVNKSLQYRFLAMILSYGFIVILFSALAFLAPEIIKMQDETLAMKARALAADRVITLHTRVWLTALAIVCVLGIHSFYAFHRVVGPLYRLTRAFEQVGGGDLSFEIRLRKKDYLHEEASVLNEMIKRLSGKLGLIKQSSREALYSLENLEEKLGKGAREEQDLAGLLKVHREHLQALIDSVEYFQLQKDRD